MEHELTAAPRRSCPADATSCCCGGGQSLQINPDRSHKVTPRSIDESSMGGNDDNNPTLSTAVSPAEPAIIEPSQIQGGDAGTHQKKHSASTASGMREEQMQSTSGEALRREVSQEDPSYPPSRPNRRAGNEYEHQHQHEARFVSQDPASQYLLDSQREDSSSRFDFDDDCGDANVTDTELSASRGARGSTTKRSLELSPHIPTPSKRRKQKHVVHDNLFGNNSDSDDEYHRERRNNQRQRRGTPHQLSSSANPPTEPGSSDPEGSDGICEGFGSRLSREEEAILESLYRQNATKGKVRLLKKSGLTTDQRQIVRKAYRKLQGKVCHSHQGDKIEDPSSEATHFARGRNNFLFSSVNFIREAVLDANTLDFISQRASRQTDKLTNVPRYDVDRFIGHLHKKLGSSQGGSRYFDWRMLGREAGVCFNAVPSRVAFLNGPAAVDYVPKERKKRKRRTSTAGDEDSGDEEEEKPDELNHGADNKASGALSKVEQQVVATTQQLVKRSKEACHEAMLDFKSSSAGLSKEEKKKRKKLLANRYGLDIDMLTFVLDRDSFTKTVENIFHLSFLVKNGKAGVAIRSEQEAAIYGGIASSPVVRAVPNEISNDRSNWPEPRQCIVSLNMGDWRELCKLLSDEDEARPIAGF